MCSCNRPPDRTWLFQRSAHFCQNVLLSSCKKRSLFCKAMARICHSEGFKGERQLVCCSSLVWGLICQGGGIALYRFFNRKFPCSTFDSPFPCPDPGAKYTPARAGAVKAGRLYGGHPEGLALTASSTTAGLGRVGMTIGGESAFAHELIVPQPCIRWVRRTLTMMQPCASAAKLRGGGPILAYGIEAMAAAGPRHLEPSSATHRKSSRRDPETGRCRCYIPRSL